MTLMANGTRYEKFIIFAKVSSNAPNDLGPEDLGYDMQHEGKMVARDPIGPEEDDSKKAAAKKEKKKEKKKREQPKSGNDDL